MRRSFLKLRKPVLTGIFSGETPQHLIAEARNAEAEGAQAIAVQLEALRPEFRTVDVFRQVVNSVNLPAMFTLYRSDKWHQADEARQDVLLAAVEAGAAMVDVIGDLYDPAPHEITHNADAIARQMELIDTIHKLGAEVVISSHTTVPRTTDEVVAHLREIEKREADVLKIVTQVQNADDLAEAFKTTLTLQREFKTPFIHLCSGPFSRPHRFVGPTLGPAIVFAVSRYAPESLMPQPTIRAMKAALDAMNWHIEAI